MKITKITSAEIKFDNGTKIEYHHDQDCCETVYADFEQLKDTTIFSEDFKRISIRGVKGSGFRLNGYFIPCYNSQNGYYSSDLSLIITYKDKTQKTIDISDFVEDQID